MLGVAKLCTGGGTRTLGHSIKSRALSRLRYTGGGRAYCCRVHALYVRKGRDTAKLWVGAADFAGSAGTKRGLGWFRKKRGFYVGCLTERAEPSTNQG